MLSKYTAIISFAAYLLVAAYKIFLLVTGKSIYWFAVSNAFDIFLIAVLQFYFYRRLGGGKLSFSRQTFRRLFHESKYYIISELMIAIFAQTDRVMLKLMIGDASVGYYSAAVTCANMTAFIFSAVINSAAPTIFESKKVSENDFNRNVRFLFSVIIYGSLLQGILLAFLARPIIFIIYGDSFGPSVAALRIVVWYTIFSYLGAVRNRWILAEGKQRLIWKIDLSGALANILLNYFLIPAYGINGAAFATLATQIFANVIVSGMIKEVRPSVKLMFQGCNPHCLAELLHRLR